MPGIPPLDGLHQGRPEDGSDRAGTMAQGDTNMNIRPLNDRVVVTRLEEARKTASGIVIPDSAAAKPETGEVIAVGPGKIQKNGKLEPLGVRKGDKVLFAKYAGQEVTVAGNEYLVMREEDIMGVIG
jgi:chaperonin GroES